MLIRMSERRAVRVTEVCRGRLCYIFCSRHAGHIAGAACATPTLDVREGEATNCRGTELITTRPCDRTSGIDGCRLWGELDHAKRHGRSGKNIPTVCCADQGVDLADTVRNRRLGSTQRQDCGE